MGIKRLLLLCLFAVTTTVLSAQSVTEHVVVKGNTLYSLSKQYGITVDALLDANPQIVGTTLSLGDILIVPKPTQADKSPLTAAVSISDSIETIDLPYLPQNRATYNLGSGAYLIDL